MSLVSQPENFEFATVHVIPELLEGASFKQSVLEVMAMLAGVGMMVIIAQYE